MERLGVFVYGTLRRGGANYPLLRRHTVAEYDARLPGHRLYVSGLPYVAPSPDPRDEVTGELMILDEAGYTPALARLDRLEGTASGLYERVACLVRFRDGDGWKDTRAWVYRGGRGHFRYTDDLVVASGEFTAGGAGRSPAPGSRAPGRDARR
ncbi:gamma-glutamylcyclotransferase family protein [Thermoactinospora rubra]|uniref:gamma-glutamylcyclotransferase family protein n=1 Tax=Thermoactinospora rubra TaxID=1088767 RepID=UPI001301F299|nr:gamma-glutamylcyclotransferase family protein [Thermoactinospora rubra]